MSATPPAGLVCSRCLAAASLLWAGVLLLTTPAHGSRVAFVLTCLFLLANAIASLWIITTTRTVPILLNVVQLVLFGVLHYQFACTFGTSHYHFQRAPHWYDWIEFHFAHLLRAADLLDTIDEFGIPIQSISHRSASAGILIVCMHVSADLFLFGLLVRSFQRFKAKSHKTILQQQRRIFAFFLLSLLCLLLCFLLAKVEQWSPADLYLWPLDNLLRLLDFGDSMQVFQWRLHRVAPTDWNGALAVFFRFTAGVWMGALLLYVRLGMLRGWGYSATQLVEHLQDGDTLIRRSAATNLGGCRGEAETVVPALIGALEDFDREVRRCSVEALGAMGHAACPAVPLILDELIRTPSTPFHATAIGALVRIGPREKDLTDVLYCLELLQKCYGVETDTHRAIGEAVRLLRGPAGRPRKAGAAPLAVQGTHGGRRESRFGSDDWGEGDEGRGMRGPTIRERVEELWDRDFFCRERTVEEIYDELEKGLLQIFAPSSLYGPLVALIAEGRLTRRKRGSCWLYRSMESLSRTHL